MYVICNIGNKMLFTCQTCIDKHFQFTLYYKISSKLGSIFPKAILGIIRTILFVIGIIKIFASAVAVVVVSIYTFLFITRADVFQCIERKTIEDTSCGITVNHLIVCCFKILRSQVKVYLFLKLHGIVVRQ